MKRKFILSIAVAAFTVLTAAAQSGENVSVNAGQFQNVVIASDLDIVIVPGNGNPANVSVDPASSDKVDVKLSRNKLYISSVKPSGKKTTVFLQVNNLKTLTVENNSQVKTIGVIDSPKVDVFVDGETTVHLRTNGDVDAHALNDAELKINYLTDRPIAKR